VVPEARLRAQPAQAEHRGRAAGDVDEGLVLRHDVLLDVCLQGPRIMSWIWLAALRAVSSADLQVAYGTGFSSGAQLSFLRRAWSPYCPAPRMA
jgi:hypothetical protein